MLEQIEIDIQRRPWSKCHESGCEVNISSLQKIKCLDKVCTCVSLVKISKDIVINCFNGRQNKQAAGFFEGFYFFRIVDDVLYLYGGVIGDRRKFPV